MIIVLAQLLLRVMVGVKMPDVTPSEIAKNNRGREDVGIYLTYKRFDELLATAWDEGHQTHWKRHWDDGCECYAYSSSECACGLYGTGELLSLKENPYSQVDSE